MKWSNVITSVLLVGVGAGGGIYAANSLGQKSDRTSPTPPSTTDRNRDTPQFPESLTQTDTTVDRSTSNTKTQTSTTQLAIQQLVQTGDCPGCDLRQADLTGMNLENANLAGANLENANLTGTRLKNADLSGANLFRANLQGSDFGCVVRINQPNDGYPGSGVSVRNSSRNGVGNSNTEINVSISRKNGTIEVDASDDCVILKGQT